MSSRVGRRLLALGRGGGCHSLPPLVRSKQGMVLGKRQVIGLSSGSCLKLTGGVSLEGRFLGAVAPRAFLPASSSSQLLANGFASCRRLRRRLTTVFKARDTLVFGDNCRTGAKVLPTIDGTRALVLTSGLMRTDLVSKVELSSTGYVQCHRGSLSRLRQLVSRGRGTCRRVVVIARDVFDVSNSRTSLRTLIRLGGDCSGVLLCISRTRTFNMQKSGKLKYTRRRGYVGSVSFLMKAFKGTVTSTKTCVTYQRIVQRCLVGGVHAFVFAATLPPVGVR